MDDIPHLYQQFLQTNKEAFEQGLYLIAYHALAGALQCVLVWPDKASKQDRLREVEVLTTSQTALVQGRADGHASAQEATALALYLGLTQSVASHRMILKLRGQT